MQPNQSNLRAHPAVTTPYGRFVGRHEDGLEVYRGVRYAMPPVGERRFGRPEECSLSSDEIDAGTDGPVSVQALGGPLEYGLGPGYGAIGEDCLSLTISAPSDRGSERLPVLVWLHGGAFAAGCGSTPAFNGRDLILDGRVVLVRVNSRLGALGYLKAEGLSPGNLGLYDQLASLEWVNRCIEAFGGDPDRVTLAGQSSGAFSVLALGIAARTRGIVSRLILQSGPYGMIPETAEAAAERGRKFVELCADGNIEAARHAPVETILSASARMREHFPTPPWASGAIFSPCEDGDLITGPLLEKVREGAAAHLPMLISYVREEATLFLCAPMIQKAMGQPQREKAFRDMFGERAQEVLAEYQGLRPFHSEAALIGYASGDHRFVGPALKLAALQAAHGACVHVGQFDWQCALEPLGATHCVELPFIFGPSSAPIHQGGPEIDRDHIGRTARGHWSNFIHAGDPNGSDGLNWPGYGADRQVMRFDRYIGRASDPAGLSWRAAMQEYR